MLCFWSCFWRRVCGLVGISPLVGSNLTWECSVDLLPYHFHPEPKTGFRSSLIGIIGKARTEDEIGKSSCSWFSLFISSLLWWVLWSLAFPALTKCSRYDHICMYDIYSVILWDIWSGYYCWHYVDERIWGSERLSGLPSVTEPERNGSSNLSLSGCKFWITAFSTTWIQPVVHRWALI